MKLDDVFSRLQEIDRAAQELIRETGFSSDTGIAQRISSSPADPNDRFLKENAELLLDPLDEMHWFLSYLNAPVSPEYVLQKFPNGRYGYLDKEGRSHIFTCGQILEARVRDRFGCQHWVKTSIEHNGFDYFLAGHSSVPLAGLTIRKRGPQA